MDVLLAALEDLDELKCLKTRDRSSRGSECWHDSAGLQLHCYPIHRFELVTARTAVTHRIHEVDVEIGIVVFLELIAPHQILLDPVGLSDRLCCADLVVNCTELFNKVLDLVEVFLFLLLFLGLNSSTLLLLFFVLLRGFLINALLYGFSLLFVGLEGWWLDLACDLSALVLETFSTRLLRGNFNEEHVGAEAGE